MTSVIGARTATNPLIVLDLANNHNGSLSHGKAIIAELAEQTRGLGFDVVVKFQYRDLDSFIHPSFQQRMDLKYVKRFQSTRLTWDDFAHLTGYAKSLGFLTSATPFDESSVRYVVDHGHDVLKIASASFTDWPLWEAIARTDLPLIASTAGATLEQVDKVVAFLSNRDREFALMHCVAIYPTADSDLYLNRISLLRDRYPGVPIGFSTHENPSNLLAGPMAIGKGAGILERHVGKEQDSLPLNDYSSDPSLVRDWLLSLRAAIAMCGADVNLPPNPAEAEALRGLGRGVYLSAKVTPGDVITDDVVTFQIPLQDGQFSANEWSKYLEVRAVTPLREGQPLLHSECSVSDGRSLLESAVDQVRDLLQESGVAYPSTATLELSHHYGMENFSTTGLSMITIVNREYCKKLLILLPGQAHPEQYHLRKEESFHMLHGSLNLLLDGELQSLRVGDLITIPPGVRHAFSTQTGAVLEEISSTHFSDDSYYTDDSIMTNSRRKSFIRYWGTNEDGT